MCVRCARASTRQRQPVAALPYTTASSPTERDAPFPQPGPCPGPRGLAAALSTDGIAVTPPTGAGPATAPAGPTLVQQRRRRLLAQAAASSAPAELQRSRCAGGAAPAANGSCACAAGWAGRTCAVCTADAVCPAVNGQGTAGCDTSLTYGPDTAYKAYSCDLAGPLKSLVPGITLLCNVRGRRLPFEDGPVGLEVSARTASAHAPYALASPQIEHVCLSRLREQCRGLAWGGTDRCQCRAGESALAVVVALPGSAASSGRNQKHQPLPLEC